MEKVKLDRINELAAKAREGELTAEETAERDALRREYIESVKKNLAMQLNNTYIVDEAGNRRKVQRRPHRQS